MDKITVVCPHCFKTNALPKKESYAKANCGHCKKSLLDTHPIGFRITLFFWQRIGFETMRTNDGYLIHTFSFF